MPQKNNKKRSGIVSLIGRSNVGKSTLLNALIGTKIAIVTSKPQTTREAIQGARTDDRGQIVFVDTPGIFLKKKDILTAKLTKRAKEALEDIDAIVYVADPTRPIGPEEETAIKLIKSSGHPRILAINKIDEDKKKFLEDYRALADNFNDSIEISALKEKNLKGLVDLIYKYIPEGEFYYPEGQFTNLDPQFRIEEIVREKIFLLLRDEVPYTTAVKVENIEDEKNILRVEANILTTDQRYKKIIIGKGGSMIKEIGKKSREELEALAGKKVFLKLDVKIDEKWQERL